MNNEDKVDEVSGGSHLEPTGVPRYPHDLFNMTDKNKARNVIEELMLDYLEKGGTIKRLDSKE